MPIGIYEKDDVDAVANAIRNNLGNDTKYTVGQMPSAINEIQTYAYNNGHSEGKAEGLEEGKAIGYEEGKTDGVTEGIEQGKTEAYAEVEPLNAELEQTLYGTDTGGKSFYDEFWDKVQNYGNRRDYPYAFGYTWGGGIYNPKYDIKCGNATSLSALFFYSKVTDTKVTIYAVGANSSPSLFSNAKELHTIRKIVVSEMNKFTTWFEYCYALENITIEGTIADTINFQWSPLTHDSLMSIINALKDFSGTDTWKTITLGADNIAKLSQDELDIMELKQWEYT